MRAKPKEGQELNGNRAVIKTDQRIPSPAGTTLLLDLTCCHKFSKPATTLSHYRRNKTLAPAQCLSWNKNFQCQSSWFFSSDRSKNFPTHYGSWGAV